MPAFDRIAAERNRLGLTQAQAAESCGVTRAMWGRYEKGKASMGMEVLIRFSDAGADPNFIVTGLRAEPSDLAPHEAELLDNFRASSEEAQRCIGTTAALLAKAGKK
ncbi:MAG: helix-turn-helix domain-containing protein [Desulfovibrionaceae bacterium]